MRSVYVITMWSGGRPAKKWQSLEKPALMEQGTGIRFVNRETKLTVEIIGSISVEEFESGKEDIEIGFYHTSSDDTDVDTDDTDANKPRKALLDEPVNDRLF
jgi:hypothetical protein